MSDTSLNALAADLAFEFGEDRQYPGEGTAARRRHMDSSGKRDETDFEFDQLPKPHHEIGEQTADRSSLLTMLASTLRRRTAASSSSRFGRWRAPDPTSLSSVATCDPRHSAYSRIALICSGSVC